jgi:site-specific DNA-methyltransferase (adenine-specific)
MKEENGGKQMKSVWRFSPPRANEKRFGKHPTQKPLALVERCIRASTNVGDLVVDPFSGSGTTGVATMKLGRRFMGAERDVTFARMASDRLSNFEDSLGK